MLNLFDTLLTTITFALKINIVMGLFLSYKVYDGHN